MSAGGYHHHLATNIWSAGPEPSADDARLLDWELVLPSDDYVTEVARSIRSAGHPVENAANGITAADSWGTRVRIRGNAAGTKV
jgi:catechol 2,3-dioxygenase